MTFLRVFFSPNVPGRHSTVVSTTRQDHYWIWKSLRSLEKLMWLSGARCTTTRDLRQTKWFQMGETIFGSYKPLGNGSNNGFKKMGK